MTTPPAPMILQPSLHVDNGILARVPGQYVGKAQCALPDAALVPDDEICIEVDAGWLGRVRLTFRKYKYSRPHGKFSAVAWSCRHAERVTPAEPPPANQQGASPLALGLDGANTA